MPRLWNETIEAHRRDVRDAILDATWSLAAAHGPLSVTMSQVAEKAGIGRATLYKYFPDVEAILRAWHERHVAGHLDQLAERRNQPGRPGEQLSAVLEHYARIVHERGRHGGDLSAVLHRGEQLAQAQRELHDLVRDLCAEAAAVGDVRGDVAPEELAAYCLGALTAAGGLPSEAAVTRLVTVTLTGLRPPA
ncbi:TetR/AcrR family transcriptional regulator [Plantactinospora sp. ZYX-F-223]|uniref:TetR/AcrR family transcriptional regulator n=1 Tax=Plantactinospora sp. ZYX-F-223 TaxID=3144103 RepID=UPI0031FD5BA6